MIFLLLAFISLFNSKVHAQYECKVKNVKERKGKWGFVLKGMGKVAYKYDTIVPQWNNYKVWRDNKLGVVDCNGTEILACAYTSIEKIYMMTDDFDPVDPNFIYVVTKDKKQGLISPEGKTITSCNYDDISSTPIATMFKVSQYNKNGIVDINGKIWIDCAYDHLEPIYETKYYASKNNKWGILDLKGKPLIPFEYDTIAFDPLHYKKQLWVKKGNKWGIIDKTNKVLIPCNYDELVPLRATTDSYKARQNGKWGVLDLKGNLLVPFLYDDISFGKKPNIYKVVSKGKMGLISSKGEIIVPLAYRQIVNIKYNSADVLLNNQWGVWDYETATFQKEEEEEVYSIVTTLPILEKSCLEKRKNACKECSDKALMTFIEQHLIYPSKAKENHQEGSVIVSFIISSSGKMKNIKKIKVVPSSPDYGFAEEALRVLSQLQQEKIWIPAKMQHKAVSYHLVLPISFKIK